MGVRQWAALPDITSFVRDGGSNSLAPIKLPDLPLGARKHINGPLLGARHERLGPPPAEPAPVVEEEKVEVEEKDEQIIVF